MELTGQTLGHYRVHEEISRGGMGIVYRATDTRLNRDVALKVLPEELTHDGDRRRRFLTEAQAASILEHPHIAVIYEADEVDGRAYIAMELIRGEKLSDLLARGRPPVARVLEIAAEVASGLARAHDKKVVHRDLKPGNVMLTDEGHAKIIDFGIAKLIEISASEGATKTNHDTGAGVVVGTMTYMSPEQARGDTLDHRSDIFTFGILVHEMLAGEPPFRGKSGIETASAILHQPTPRLPPLGPSAMAEASADIQRIVDKCLAKDPADRYQGMKDLVVDLRAARRRLETGSQATAAVPAVPSPPFPRWAIAALLVVGVALAIGIPLSRNQGAGHTVANGTAEKPSVAVLYFDNASGDAELDWMRTGITEMVVTDLSQSTDIEVVGTDRLYGVLAEMRRQDDRVLTPEVISAVAEQTGVDRVVVGSYMRSGEAIRINVRLQDARTGRIESSERVEGTGGSALFAMIDDLSRRLRATFETLSAGGKLLTPPAGARAVAEEGGLDRGLGDVTTSSIEAYRLYAEGVNLHERSRTAEAVVLFEKAIAIDPSFAVAYTKLAVAENNLGHFDRRDKYGALALKLADRLTPRERFYIEGYYYATRPATLGRAIEAYKKCVALDPGHQGCSHNLALIYYNFGRYRDAIPYYEQIVRRGGTFAPTYQQLAGAFLAMGDADRALDTARAFAKRNPESASALFGYGSMLLGANQPQDAMREFSQAAALDARNVLALLGKAVATAMLEDWTATDESAGTMWRSDDQAWRWFGAATSVSTNLFRGRSAEALRWAGNAATAYKIPNERTAGMYEFASGVHLARGEAEAAVNAASRALEQGKGRSSEPQALIAYARAQSAAGRSGDAEKAIDSLSGISDPLAPERDRRRLNMARGFAALARGDATAAVKPLQDAAAALTPRIATPVFASDHVRIWESLGEALFNAGRQTEALPWFEKAASAGVERVRFPVEYVRSFYFLGRIYEQQGNAAKAREAYRRFVGYWKDGDLDRERVAEAQRKISS